MSDVAKEARVSVKEAQSATGQSRRRTRARRPVIPPSGPPGEASLDGVATTWSCLVEHLSLPPNRNDDGRRASESSLADRHSHGDSMAAGGGVRSPRRENEAETSGSRQLDPRESGRRRREVLRRPLPMCG